MSERPHISIQENVFQCVVCEMADICLGLNVLTLSRTIYAAKCNRGSVKKKRLNPNSQRDIR